MPATGVFVGIDWGGSRHQLCVLDSTGVVLRQRQVGDDVAGFGDLAAFLAGHGEVVGIVIERAEGLLVEHLQEHGYRLFCVFAKMSARARERYRMASAKSDSFDAFVLADVLRHEHRQLRPMAAPSPLLAELRAPNCGR